VASGHLNDGGDGCSIAGEGSITSGTSSSGFSGGSMNRRLATLALACFRDGFPFAQVDRYLISIE
jgi:hypothetical protein